MISTDDLLHVGLDDIRRGQFLSDAARVALDTFALIFTRRYDPPGVVRAPLTADDNAFKKRFEAAVRGCTIDWTEFDAVLAAIGSGSTKFGWWALEHLPIVDAFTSRQRLGAHNLRYYVALASSLNVRTYQPIRDLFHRASADDKPRFVLYLRAQQGLQSRDMRDPMVASHCDKWPAYLALWQEFAAQLTG